MKSLTNQFDQVEMDTMAGLSATALIVALVISDPIVALRGMAELLLHEDARLKECLANHELTKHWEKGLYDFDADERDEAYAQRLWGLGA